MKRKSNQSHSRHEEHTDACYKDQDCGDIVARLGKELIEEYLNTGHLGRRSDVSLDQATETLEWVGMDHRKRIKSVSSIDSEQYEEVRDPHGCFHGAKNGPVKHRHHSNHPVDESYGLAFSAHGSVQAPAHFSTESPGPEHSCAEIQSATQHRMSTSTRSSLSSPSDSEPVTQVGSSPAQTRKHYRKDSATHSEVIHFHNYNEDKKDPQTIVNDVLEIIKTPAKCNSKRNLYSP